MKTRNFILLIILLLFPSNIFCQYKFKKLTIEEAMETGDMFRRSCMLDSSSVYYSAIYNSYDKNMSDKEKHLCATACYWTAYITYFGKGDFITAFDLYLKGLKIIEECKNKNGIQKFYKGLGDIYWTNNDLENSKQCYEHGYELAEKYKDTIMIADIANHLAGLNAEIKNFDKADYYLNIANYINKDSMEQRYMHMYVSGLIEKFKGNNEKAIQILQKSIKYNSDHNLHITYECYSHYELYHLFTKTGEQDSIKKHLFDCYELAQIMNVMELLPTCLKDLSLLYANSNDYKNALKCTDFS